MLSNAAGYFHWPPVWFGDLPENENQADWNEEILRRSLPLGISTKVLRQGICIFDFSSASLGCIDPYHDWVKDPEAVQKVIYQRIQVLNAHLLCLYHSLAEKQGNSQLSKMIVTPSNMITYHSLDDVGAPRPESHVPAQIHYMKSNNGIPQGFEWWQRKRSATVSIEVIMQSYDLLGSILEHKSADTLDLIHLFARSCKAYEDHHFDLCVATSWTLTEKLLYFYWDGYLDHLNKTKPAVSGKEKFINTDRRKTLTNGRDYSASVVAEILSLGGIIPSSLYEELTGVRQDRNNWVHKLRVMDAEKAQRAVRLAGDMLKYVYDIDLRIPLALSMLL